MAPAPITEDYYAILEVSQSADGDTMKSSFKSLARLRHSDRDRNNPTATAEFQLLQAAYDTLKDSTLRRDYDLQYPSTRRQAPPSHPERQGPQATFGHNLHQNSDEAKTHAQRSVEELEQAETQAQQKIEELKTGIQQLCKEQTKLEGDLSKTRRALRETKTALAGLQAKEDEDIKDEANRSSWYGYFFIPQLSAAQADERNRSQTGRRTGQIVLESRLDQQKTAIEDTEAQLCETGTMIQAKLCQEREACTEREAASQAAEQARREEKLRRDAEERRQREEKTRQGSQKAERRQGEGAYKERGSHREQSDERHYKDKLRRGRRADRAAETRAACRHTGPWRQKKKRGVRRRNVASVSSVNNSKTKTYIAVLHAGSQLARNAKRFLSMQPGEGSS